MNTQTIVEQIAGDHCQPSGLDYVAAQILIKSAYKGGTMDGLVKALERGHNEVTTRHDEQYTKDTYVCVK